MRGALHVENGPAVPHCAYRTGTGYDIWSGCGTGRRSMETESLESGDQKNHGIRWEDALADQPQYFFNVP